MGYVVLLCLCRHISVITHPSRPAPPPGRDRFAFGLRLASGSTERMRPLDRVIYYG